MDLLENIFRKEASKVGFIELKKDTKIKIGNIEIDDKLPLPVIQDNILQDIKKEAMNSELENLSEAITLDYVVDGIIYLLGSDNEFKNIDVYKSILLESKDNIEDYIFYLGMKYLEKEMIKEAGVQFRALLEVDKENVKALFNYALVVEMLGEKLLNGDSEENGALLIDHATRLFEEVLDLDDSFDLAYYKLGYHYKNLEQFLKASIMWEKFIERSSDDLLCQSIREEIEIIESETNMESALTYLVYNDYSKALDYLLKLIPKYEDRWNVNLLLGRCYLGLNDVELALSYYERSLELNPTNSDIYNEIGILYFNIGDLQKAKEVLSDGIKNCPEDYKLYFNRGLAHFNLGDFQLALDDLEEAKDIDSNNDQNIIDTIEEIKKYL